MRFKLSGVQHYKDNLIDILVVNDDYHLNKSEILESYIEDDVIYQYEIYDGPATLVPEPDNAYDPNAIAVMAEGVKVGYVPPELCKGVKPLLDDDHCYHVAIMGGPYKEIVADDDDKLQIKRGSLNFTATLTIDKKRAPESNEPVIHLSAPVADHPDPTPSGAARALNYIMMVLSIVLVLMSLLVTIVKPIAGVIGIVFGIFCFLYFKKRNRK